MIELIITDAGRAAIVNARQTGLNQVLISQIAVGSGRYTPSQGQASLLAEIKRLPVSEGGNLGDNDIHVGYMDESTDAYTVYEFGLITDAGVLFAVAASDTEPYLEKGSASIAILAADIHIDGLNANEVAFGPVAFGINGATRENSGAVELATEDEAAAGADAYAAITPATLAHVLTGRAASNAETQAGTAADKFVTPAALSARTATTGRAGVVALASDAEAQAGANNTKAVTSLGVNKAIAAYTGVANGLKVTARATVTARALSDRFADQISPKDFGATGDGTTNDTAAFAALEAAVSGRDIDLGGATYLVTERPAGNNYHNGFFKLGSDTRPAVYDFFKFGGTAPEAVNVRRDFSEATRGGGALLAADWVRAGDAAGAVVQSAVWDDVNRYLYTLHATTGDYGVINRFSGMKFGAAVKNSASVYSAASQYVGHQGLGIQYMSGGTVKLWAAMSYEAAGAPVTSRGTKAVRFAPPATNGANLDNGVEVFNLFPTSANSNQATTVCTSYSGRYLIAKMNEDGNTFWVRIFRLDDLTSAGDYANKFVHEFRIDLTRDVAGGVERALQGMACDDRHIYFLAASYGYSEKHSIYVTDMYGNIVDEYRDVSVGKEIGRAAGTTYYEPESLFFMRLNGSMTLVLQIATGDTTGKRLCHLIALNTRMSYYLPVGTGVDSTHGVAIDEQARIVNAEGAANISLYPSGQPVYTQARAGANQAALARFSNDDAASSLVFFKSRGASVGESASVQANDKVGQIHFIADNGNVDYSGTVQGARVGYISCDVFESSTITSAGTTNLGIRGAVRIYACSDAADRAGKGIEILDNGLRPTDDNALNLGTSGRRWKEVFATADVISTSDAREKRNISPIPPAVLRAWSRVGFWQYQLNGEDKTVFFGVVAQDIIEAFAAEGLNALDYGIVREDTREDGETRYSVRYRDIMILEAALVRAKLEGGDV